MPKFKGCPECETPWHWEQMHGMRLYRDVGRRKVYRVKCLPCGTERDVNSRGRLAPAKETT